jgi:hypothetical protein
MKFSRHRMFAFYLIMLAGPVVMGLAVHRYGNWVLVPCMAFGLVMGLNFTRLVGE